MKKIVLSLCVFVSAYSAVHAQSLGLAPQQVTLNVRPQILQPLQAVSLDLESYNTDLNRARISWYVDGVLVSQKLGGTSYSVTAPAVGERSVVQMRIDTVDQGTVNKEFTLAPALVDLVFEATNSYAPPLYQGKKLPAHEGGVTVHALPYIVNQSGSKIDPASLVYTWRVGNDVQTKASGYGKQSFSFKGSPYYRAKEIQVQVESVDGSYVARRSIEIPAYDPVVRFYREHPLWGTDLSRAFIAGSPLYLEDTEMEIRSVPYFISDAGSVSLVEYDWRMNGQPLVTFGDRNIVNLRIPEDQEGQTQINLKITHNSKILQIAESLFTVVFGEDLVSRDRERRAAEETPNFFGTSN